MTNADLQRALAALGFDPGPADGRLGKQTTWAVRAFQFANGLFVDGIAGRQTRAALKQAAAAPKPPGSYRSEPDKSAILGSVPAAPAAGGSDQAAEPSNAASLQLLGTSRRLEEIIWHCTATPEGKDFTVSDIRAWHKQRGFSDIGYHYVVYRDGRVMVGRPVGQIGAHCADHGKNAGTIGCSYVGGVSSDGKAPKDTRTPAQRASMLWLTERLIAKHPSIRRVTGHNEYAAKACPSFDVRKDALARGT